MVSGWTQHPDELADKLDFAVIALDGTPGNERKGAAPPKVGSAKAANAERQPMLSIRPLSNI